MADDIDKMADMLAEANVMLREQMATANPRRARRLERMIAKNERSIATFRAAPAETRQWWADVLARSPLTKEADDADE